jgi:hypothetical protein
MVSTDAKYDRSIYIRLAMDVKKTQLVEGLVKEMHLTDRNTQLMVNASNLYPHENCRRGLDCVFTWRRRDEDGHDVDRMEIR